MGQNQNQNLTAISSVRHNADRAALDRGIVPTANRSRASPVRTTPPDRIQGHQATHKGGREIRRACDNVCACVQEYRTNETCGQRKKAAEESGAECYLG